jgi:hypothetical protein
MGVGIADTKALMDMLMNQAKEIRSGYKFSEDEKMMPIAFINADELTIIAMHWKDDKEKYKMAATMRVMARMRKAKSLSFVTDSRMLKPQEFQEHFKIPADTPYLLFRKMYQQILKEHGGSLGHLPRHVWIDCLMVFTNGPEIPLTLQRQAYIEGENDTVKFIDLPTPKQQLYKSDMLTDWW